MESFDKPAKNIAIAIMIIGISGYALIPVYGAGFSAHAPHITPHVTPHVTPHMATPHTMMPHGAGHMGGTPHARFENRNFNNNHAAPGRGFEGHNMQEHQLEDRRFEGRRLDDRRFGERKPTDVANHDRWHDAGDRRFDDHRRYDDSRHDNLAARRHDGWHRNGSTEQNNSSHITNQPLAQTGSTSGSSAHFAQAPTRIEPTIRPHGGSYFKVDGQ